MVKPEDYGDKIDVSFLKKINKIFLFNNKNNDLNRNKKKIISGYLGLSSNLSRFNFSYILWKKLFINIFNLNIFSVYFKALLKIVHKITTKK